MVPLLNKNENHSIHINAGVTAYIHSEFVSAKTGLSTGRQDETRQEPQPSDHQRDRPLGACLWKSLNTHTNHSAFNRQRQDKSHKPVTTRGTDLWGPAWGGHASPLWAWPAVRCCTPLHPGRSWPPRGSDLRRTRALGGSPCGASCHHTSPWSVCPVDECSCKNINPIRKV